MCILIRHTWTLKLFILFHVTTGADVTCSQYTFPPQPLVISACADLAQRISSGYSTGHNTPTMDSWMIPNGDSSRDKAKRNKILMVIGCVSLKFAIKCSLISASTYSIGKERIVKGILYVVRLSI